MDISLENPMNFDLEPLPPEFRFQEPYKDAKYSILVPVDFSDQSQVPFDTEHPTMAHFFGPVGSSATGAGRGLVTRTKNLYHREDGKMVQVQHSNTHTMETVADPKYGTQQRERLAC